MEILLIYVERPERKQAGKSKKRAKDGWSVFSFFPFLNYKTGEMLKYLES